ncbi:ATP-binding protein [Rhizobium sp. ARZ01]|uniref:ATP-binding protein n=1 Tax=Rhizobium sp. ARZ01 TaxID=2769313 RepID=UPI00177ACDDE|nr:ATP-binding protein [Rhizobium sp. ARZ01]MBD9372844.1 ATP-binding protein [Rhizobium sp. ARZ01]
MVAGEQDRRDDETPGNRLLGRVVACGGSRATISAVAEAGQTALTELWSVGRLISISVGENRVVALVYAMSTDQQNWAENRDTVFRIEVELLGEVHPGPDGREEFSSGISNYPYLGAIAHRIRASDLAKVYDTGQNDVCVIGKLTQDETLDATIHVPSMLSKHFAIVGTTGVGKSTAVTLLLHKAIQADPKLRVLILDPHNEFAAAFPDHSVVIETDTLDLPFWLFRLEEFSEVIFRGRPPVPEEIDALRDLIPEAKKAFRGSGDSGLMRRNQEKSSITVDTPVPYRIADLLAMVDERIGRLEGRTEKPHLRSLKVKIMSAINDPRFHFMFSSNTITDTILDTIARIFRIPGEGKPITTFQLAGIPSEVVNSVASVLCRMAFEIGLWSNGGVHMLVVCEEAHRYVPADPTLGFLPTRQAIARIAKEGRKYGVSLGIITQRPGELDPTILSQCSTVFAMRLANDADQEIIRSAIPNSSSSTTSFISSIGNGEAIAFGEAVAVPMRMKFTRIQENRLPKANGASVKASEDNPNSVDLRSIVGRMRSVTGPDISAFQESYLAAESTTSQRTETSVSHPSPHTDDDWTELHPDAASEEPTEIEPYRPEMLPRNPTGPSPLSAHDRFEALRRELGTDVSREQPADGSARPSLRPAFGEAGNEPRREGSIRDQLLKKPLSSLIRK